MFKMGIQKTAPAPTKGSIKHCFLFGKTRLRSSVKRNLPPAHFKNGRCLIRGFVLLFFGRNMRAMTVSHVVCNAQSRLAQEICQYQSPRRLDQALLATQDATCLPTLFYHASCAVNNRLAAWYQAKQSAN